MSFSYLEKKVFKKGYQVVAGIDEAGRGPLAGPVVAAIVVVSAGLLSLFRFLPRTGIRDSKSLSPKQREEIFKMIQNEPNIEWRVSAVWPRVIDRINIWRATLLAWQRCLEKLNAQPDFLFLDGKTGLAGVKIKQQPIVKGDQKIFLLSLASIMAKVSRDRMMRRLARKYPNYEFDQHKGYGTKLHLEMLKKFGPSEVHRKSFRPVFENLSFKDKVYYVVSQIPKGRTMSYRQVAQRVGRPQAYRAVGNVLNRNISSDVPCHRVIRSDRKLGGYRNGSQLKKNLLKKEGVKLKYDFN
jgi:ribonuclease HII